MRTKYIDLIDQTFDFPQDEFHLREDRLMFHGIDLMRLIEEYGTSKNLPFITQSNIKFGLFCIPLQTSSSYRYDIW